MKPSVVNLSINFQELRNCLNAQKYVNVFLVTGKKSFEENFREEIFSALKEFKVKIFNDFSVNPKIEDVRKGVDELSKDSYDLILALGGGSVMDMAKLIAYFSRECLENIVLPPRMNSNKVPIPELWVIPTTAGSGSEATHFAVAYKGKEKFSVASQDILPSRIFLRPENLASQSDCQRAVCYMDAFSQSMESMWSLGATQESIDYAKRSLKLLVDVYHERDFKSYSRLQEAAFLSGCAINISKTTAPHALSYSLTSDLGLSHGHAVACFLLPIIKLHHRYSDKDKVLKNVFISIAEILDVSEDSIYIKTKEIIDFLEINTSFREIGLTQTKFNALYSRVNIQRLANNPVMVSFDNYKSFWC